jgi:hypothetical protein
MFVLGMGLSEGEFQSLILSFKLVMLNPDTFSRLDIPRLAAMGKRPETVLRSSHLLLCDVGNRFFSCEPVRQNLCLWVRSMMLRISLTAALTVSELSHQGCVFIYGDHRSVVLDWSFLMFYNTGKNICHPLTVIRRSSLIGTLILLVIRAIPLCMVPLCHWLIFFFITCIRQVRYRFSPAQTSV